MSENRQSDVVLQQWDVSCGAAALATLMTYDLNMPITERKVAAGLLRFTSVERVCRQLGFSLLDLKSEKHRTWRNSQVTMHGEGRPLRCGVQSGAARRRLLPINLGSRSPMDGNTQTTACGAKPPSRRCTVTGADGSMTR